MKKRVLSILFIATAVIFGSCTVEQQEAAKKEAQEEIQELKEEVAELRNKLGLKEAEMLDPESFDFTDHGPDFLTLDIEEYTEANTNFRTTLWTGHQMQLTLMSIPVGGDIGEEIHNTVEQFIRIESGEGEVFMGETQETMKSVAKVGGDEIVLVPQGVWHNIKNIGDEPLKLYSIYAPAEHPKGTVHVTMEEGHAEDHDH
ncbi:MAG: cupin domain-containing protein [Porphyromonas sp.]|nr:cupin domain-containing protein [Porphyromonas sp.]